MAKSYPAPTTGYLNNGGLVQLGKSNIADAWDYITIPAPNQPWRIVVDGTIPDDTSGVACSVSVFEGTLPLFSASGTWQTQGQSSQGANKKNWKFKLRNATTGNKLAVKIGKWFAMSSITVKGYGTDRTLMRDSLTTELWRRIHAYPSGLLAPISAYQYFDDEDFGVHQSALFSTAGFPVELWNGGKFLGLYVLRADNDPSSYLMDTDNQKHILMQPQHASSLWSSPYNSTVWDFPSPTVKGYETGDGMGGLNSDVDQAAARVVNWMYGCVTGSIDFRSTYKSYLDLNSALDFILLNEVSLSFDSLNNNFMFGSWDATKNSGIWHFWPYDEDETFGVAWFLSADGQINPEFGWVTEDNSGGNNQQAGIFKIILQQMRPEIRARWRELRDAGIISVKTINGVLMDQGAMIDPATMAADIANWPKSAATGNQLGVIKVAQSMGYITQISARRIAWLDAQWGYSA